MSSTPARRFTPEELLGPLNAVEKKNAPEILFVAGDPEILRAGPRVSVVGTRKASTDALAGAARLASLLVARGVAVVSGLARGVDTAAHRAAIEAGGRTIAVLGTPLEECYPAENADLQRFIMERHLAVSQFGPGFPARRGNFPMRNRVMALISDASVIVEAGDTSGALHQGWEALRLGRPLFLAKTIADDESLKWPREMIRYGARVLSDQNVEDLFDLLPTRALSPDALLSL